MRTAALLIASALALSTDMHAEAACVSKFEFVGMHVGDPNNGPPQYCKPVEHGLVRCVRNIGPFGSIETLSYFISAKFVAVTLNFPSDTFEVMLAAYREKFGCEPTALTHSPVTNGFGAQFDNIVATWHFADGDFRLARYGSDRTHGVGDFQAEAYKKFGDVSNDALAKSVAGSL